MNNDSALSHDIIYGHISGRRVYITRYNERYRDRDYKTNPIPSTLPKTSQDNPIGIPMAILDPELASTVWLCPSVTLASTNPCPHSRFTTCADGPYESANGWPSFRAKSAYVCISRRVQSLHERYGSSSFPAGSWVKADPNGMKKTL